MCYGIMDVCYKFIAGCVTGNLSGWVVIGDFPPLLSEDWMMGILLPKPF